MIAIVLVTKDRVEMFRKCITSLQTGRQRGAKVACYALASKDSTQLDAADKYAKGLIDDLILEAPTPSVHETFLRGSDHVMKWKPDYLLLTADDYVYQSDWDVRATQFLSPSYDVSHISLELEPDFPWNQPRGKLTRQGVTGLLRATVPGANWMMTVARWWHLKPLYADLLDNSGLDHIINGACWRHGMKLAALNCAEHIGAYCSTVGNTSFQEHAKPLPEEWKV